MIRATTPTHIFYFEEDPSEYERILITYVQGGSIILEKHKEDLTIEENNDLTACSDGNYKASYMLTQDETRMFHADGKEAVYVQVRVLTEDGEALASDIKQIAIRDVLNDEVLA